MSKKVLILIKLSMEKMFIDKKRRLFIFEFIPGLIWCSKESVSSIYTYNKL